MTFTDLLFWFLISVSLSLSTADSIHGCGGFVEASSTLIKLRKASASDAKLDYSHITVELRTTDGLIKDRTQCAPNGYYFIPVYDKGSFVVKVKGPEGWSWDPDNVPVIVDQNGCNANADINFRFTGFMISGRVMGAVGGESCSSKAGGPSNVKVDLLSLSDDHVASALTSAKGEYSFTNIIPGSYKLRPSHPNLKLKVRGSSQVDLGFGNSVVDDVFSVSGYDLQGSVVAQGNPILGVHVYLYSDDVLDVPCPQGVGNSPRQKSALCHAVSDADGKFKFDSIPCGVYELLPYYKGENTVFDVSPPSMTVSVEHHHVTISQKFQVTGFSVGGRVVDDNNAGVDGVRIIVDGQQRAVTDSEGYYKLDQVTSKRYSISAEKDHYKFSALENFLVLPNMANIDTIKAVYYDICGVVRTITGNPKAKVALTHGPENVKPQMKLTDDSGNFCFEVPPGEYRLSALASESSSSLLFSPPYIDFRVDQPLLNIEFSQAQVNIHGSVLCKENCGPSISLSLERLMGGGTQEKKTIFLSEDSNDFIFSKVFPGKYRLEVKHSSSSAMPEGDSWCWEQNAVDLDVGTEDMQGIVFIQKGYWIDIISSHETDAYIQQPDSSRLDLLIMRGSQRICVEVPGEHELYFVNSCIFFGRSSVKFNTLNPTPIYLKAEKYLLKGAIHFDSSMLQDSSDLSEHIIIDIFNKDNVLVDTITTRFVSGEIEQSGVSLFEYTFWSDLGEEFSVAPRHSSDSQEKKILFYPRQRQVSVTSDGCQATIPTISARIGLYLEGSVSPPISGVNIRILAAGESINAPLHNGDLAFATETGDDGSFLAGPLYDDTSYTIEASKPGYHLRPLGSNSFTCQKLSQIVVNIYGGVQAGELFPSVLLSLSGEDGYRNNSVSGAGGTFSFDNLFPGSFYLRPLLKEYSFSPAAVAIELESGESKEVVFHATRVAYSVMGTVSLLSGQPKEGVYIEARSESEGYYEESKTDNSGYYRLRGLLPDTTYLIKVAAKDDFGVVGIERASPESVSLQVGSEDIRGVDFVVFEQPDITILSGHVEGIDLELLQSHLSVEIKSAGDTPKIVSVFPLPLSRYFEIRDLPKGKLLVQLRSGLPSHTHRFESEILEVDLENQPQIHVGPLRYKVEEHHHKQDLTPAPVFPLITGVVVIALFISMPRLKDLYNMALGMTPLSSTTMSSKKEVKKQVLRKRTY